MPTRRYQPTTNSVGVNLKFIDLVVTVGVVASIISLFVNNKNNDVLRNINSNLKKINDSGGLDMIAQIGNNNNVVEVNINENE